MINSPYRHALKLRSISNGLEKPEIYDNVLSAISSEEIKDVTLSGSIIKIPLMDGAMARYFCEEGMLSINYGADLSYALNNGHNGKKREVPLKRKKNTF